MKMRFKAVCALLLGLNSLPAATYTAGTTSFTTSFTAFDPALSSQYVYFNNSTVSLNVNPFNSSLGTLVKVEINWDFGGSFTGTTGSSGGSASLGFGGSFYVNSIGYGGSGNGNSSGAFANLPFSFTMTDPSSSNYSFVPANAGVTYDPALLTIFTGGNQYSVSFDAGNSGYGLWSGIASGTMSTYRNVTVIYTYDAVPDFSKWGSVQGLLACATLLRFRRRTGA
jgi:hypothetical protein